MHQLGPVAVAALGDVEAERREEIERVPWPEPRVGQCATQRQCIRRCLGLAEQRRLEQVQGRELLSLAEPRMVGHIVGGAGEAVECENGSAKARSNENRRDREVLVPLGLAGLEICCVDHRLAGIACIRPFHSPPRPRQCWHAESTVNIT